MGILRQLFTPTFGSNIFVAFTFIFHQCFSEVVNVAGFDVLPYSVDSVKVMLSEDGTTWSTYSEAGQDKVRLFQSSLRTNRLIVTIIKLHVDLKGR